MIAVKVKFRVASAARIAFHEKLIFSINMYPGLTFSHYAKFLVNLYKSDTIIAVNVTFTMA